MTHFAHHIAPLWYLYLIVSLSVLAASSTANGSGGADDRYTVIVSGRQITPPAMASDQIHEYLQKSPLKHAHVIVQLDSIPTERERRDLQELGIELLIPVKGAAWLASVPTDLSTAQLMSVPILWIGSLQAHDKLAPALRQRRAGPHALREPGRIELLVKLFEGADRKHITDKLEQLGAKIRQDASATLGVLIVSIPEDDLDALANLPGIRYVEPTLPPGQPESDRARAIIGIDPITTAGNNGNGSTVGVFEYEHVYAAHPDFGSRITQGDADAIFYHPDYAHATMTAGMIAGDGSLSVAHGGTALQWRGVAPGASVRFYAYEDTVSSVTNYMGDVQDAVQSDNVDIGNNSWGDPGCTPFAYGTYAGRASFLDDVVRGSYGRPMAVVFSVGNERNNTDCVPNGTGPFANYGTLNHPKSAKNILAVGAIDSANSRMTSYSSWGPTQDGRIKPEVVAAGHHNGTPVAGVTDATNPFGVPPGAANQQGYRVPYRYDPGNPIDFRYGWYSMTSSAAAAVSGVYALMLNAWRDKYPGHADPLPSSYKALVVHTARDLDDGTNNWHNRGPDYASGYGVVDAENAVAAVNDGFLQESNVGDGGTVTYNLTVAAGTPSLKVTMAWDDPAAVDNANPTLLNDLDLVVTDPMGTRQYPWTLDPANPAATAVKTRADNINNLEQVDVDNPEAGAWEVRVVGSAVPEGPQSFSVVFESVATTRPLPPVLTQTP